MMIPFASKLLSQKRTMSEDYSYRSNSGTPIMHRTRRRSKWLDLSCPAVTVILLCLLCNVQSSLSMSERERKSLRDESRDMFYHAYDAYLDNAFPADELMPLSCRGRFRGREPNRGDIDDALGNFSLTLIDSVDTLAIMGDFEEFERGVKLIIDNVSFDHDIVVSVFETNIRIVGGLISAHVLSEYIQRLGRMKWYKGELLNMATDIGFRLLPAFNSTTGLPHPRVNLRYGIQPGKIRHIGETCTACAGTMILEFAALSRLSGEPIFEEKAGHAMDVLWASRHRMSNLVGNVLNINTADWTQRSSGIGAGIDSYYEYTAKAYILLGEDKYLTRWQTHYSAIMKYLSQGQSPLLLDVHMHRPQTTSRHFFDALGAFWPGLQVLMGDIKPAVESHEILYQIMQRHHFIPEAFTTDFQVHWGQHLLRPEFVESTYFLYRATGDPHYLEVGKKVLESLQLHARVPCGYAVLKDVRTLQKEDRMDSFVLAETFKYLYLLFAKEEELRVDINAFVFTTEAHILPLSLARLSNATAVPVPDDQHLVADEDVEFARSCPSTEYLFPGRNNFASDLREPWANLVTDKCPLRKAVDRKLMASEFQSGNSQHLKMVQDMGITIVALPDGRVQLLHTFANAKSTDDAEEGLLFMQEMIELSKQQATLQDNPPKVITFTHNGVDHLIHAGPAQFGKDLIDGFSVTANVAIADPIQGCGDSLNNGKDLWGKIVIVERGVCMFVEKARLLESVGAKGGIVIDNSPGTTAGDSPLFAMSGDGTDDVSIPMVFVFSQDSTHILEALKANPQLEVTLQESMAGKDGKPQTWLNLAQTLGNIEVLEEHEDTSSEPDSNDLTDLTSPMDSILQKSRTKINHYYNNNKVEPDLASTSQVETLETEASKSTDELIIIRTDDSGKTVAEKITTLTGPNGEIKTIKTVEEFNFNGETKEPDLIEVTTNDSPISDRSEDGEQYDQVQRVYVNRVHKNPGLPGNVLNFPKDSLFSLLESVLRKEGTTDEAIDKLFELVADGDDGKVNDLEAGEAGVSDEQLAKYREAFSDLLGKITYDQENREDESEAVDDLQSEEDQHSKDEL